MKKRKSPKLLVILLIILISIIGIGVKFVSKYLPSKEQMNLNEYFGEETEGEMFLTIGASVLEEKGKMSGDTVYLPISVVNTYLNKRFYWDGPNFQVLYATPSELTAVAASTEPGNQVWVTNDTVYLSLPYVQQYTDLDVVIAQNPARIAIWNQFENINLVTAAKKTAVRNLGGIKAPILTRVEAGEEMLLIEEFENWYKVATRSGFVGFVQKKHVSVPAITSLPREFAREEYTYLTMERKVNLVWHQVTSQEANGFLSDSIANMTGVNVISPTWYSIADNAGNITSLASLEYVAAAHERGLKVWGLVDNFSENISTYETLSSTLARQNLIAQLVQSALEVGLDGINIDFEMLTEETGVHFLEFLREMSIECHKNGLTLSVDNPVPKDFTSHYDRKEQGEVVDYVIIMGYDEHYYGDTEAGSVASLPWVEEGIMDTIAEVPAERVINAIPFYCRLWKTLAGTLSSEAIGMETAQQVLADNHVETYWDTELFQNVGSYEGTDGAYYQIWVEDAQSISEKVKLIPKYGLAGVAEWKLGLQDDAIWQIITDLLQ